MGAGLVVKGTISWMGEGSFSGTTVLSRLGQFLRELNP